MPLPAEILSALPEDIRGSEHLAAYNDLGAVVKDLIGSKTADWRGSLPDDLKADPALVSFKDLPSLAKSFVETKKMVGQTLRPPAADAPDDEWDRYYRAGGKPNAPEEYKINMPQGITIPPEEEKALRLEAYRLGLNSRQMQGLFDSYASDLAAAQKAEQAELAKIEAAYKQKWGPNYNRNRALVTRTMERVDPEKRLEGLGIGNHPVIVDLLLEWSRKLVEDGLMPGDVAGVTTREDAIARAKDLMAKPEYAKSKAGDPIFDEVRKLHQIAYD